MYHICIIMKQHSCTLKSACEHTEDVAEMGRNLMGGIMTLDQISLEGSLMCERLTLHGSLFAKFAVQKDCVMS